jgi:hypothetical protein
VKPKTGASTDLTKEESMETYSYEIVISETVKIWTHATVTIKSSEPLTNEQAIAAAKLRRAAEKLEKLEWHEDEAEVQETSYEVI